jgi:hypothetical protein
MLLTSHMRFSHDFLELYLNEYHILYDLNVPLCIKM